MRSFILRACLVAVAAMLAAPVVNAQDATNDDEQERVICEYTQSQPHVLNPIRDRSNPSRANTWVCVSAARCRFPDTSFVPTAIYCKAIPYEDSWACPDATYCGNSWAIDAWYPERILNMTAAEEEDEPDR